MARQLTQTGRKRRRFTGEQRAKWVAKFRQSGLSARDFTKRYRLPYPGLLAWNRNVGAGEAPVLTGFVEVELSAERTGLVVEIGDRFRMRGQDADQARLAGHLLGTLPREAGC